MGLMREVRRMDLVDRIVNLFRDKSQDIEYLKNELFFQRWEVRRLGRLIYKLQNRIHKYKKIGNKLRAATKQSKFNDQSIDSVLEYHQIFRRLE